MERLAYRAGTAVLMTILALAVSPAEPRQARPPALETRGVEGAKPPYPHPGLDRAIRRQQQRQEYIGLEALVESLGLREGMTVLDIGAGPGYASFLFAEKLHGTGRVLATDIRADFVEYIRNEAKNRGLNNLEAAVVQAEGLDAFYSGQHYDLVLLSNVYHCIENRVDYFTRLRALLNDGARLVLIMYNQAPVFAVGDVYRVEDLAQTIVSEWDERSLSRVLSTATRELARDRTDLEAIRRSVVADFNRVLADPQFYKNFYQDSYFRDALFTPVERDFANWLLMSLGESGALEQEPGSLDPRERRALLKLNRLLLAKEFGGFLAQGGLGAYVPAGDANRHTSKYVMFRELAAAGYAAAEEIPLSEYYDAVVMTPRAR